MEQSNFAKKAVAALKEYCDREYGGSVNAMIDDLGIEVGNGVVHKWFRGSATPQLKVIGPFMDKIGADIVTPNRIKDPNDLVKYNVKSEEKSAEKIANLCKKIKELKVKIDIISNENQRLIGERDAFQAMFYKAWSEKGNNIENPENKKTMKNINVSLSN